MSKKKAGLSANAKWGISFLVEIVVMLFMSRQSGQSGPVVAKPSITA